MVHTAQYYINIKIEGNEYGDVDKFIKYTNSIYKNKGIAINSIRKTYCLFTIFYTVDFIKLLNKVEINELDINNINDEIDKFIYDITGFTNVKPTLIRIDYRWDVVINKRDREMLLYLYSKALNKYKFKIKNTKNKTTIYFSSKSISGMIYDKEVERINKNEKIQEYEKDVLRFEVALKNRHLNYKKRKFSMEKELKAYLNEKSFNSYIEEHLGKILYKGDYHTIYHANKIISESLLKEKDKQEILEFIKFISKNGVTKCKEQYSKYKFNKYINLLEKLNINPILIPKNRRTSTYIKNPLYSS